MQYQLSPQRMNLEAAPRIISKKLQLRAGGRGKTATRHVGQAKPLPMARAGSSPNMKGVIKKPKKAKDTTSWQVKELYKKYLHDKGVEREAEESQVMQERMANVDRILAELGFPDKRNQGLQPSYLPQEGPPR